MKPLSEIPIQDAIMFYFEKHHALRHGDMEKLRELKNKCPEIFDETNDAEIRSLIAYAKSFQASDRYKQLCRLELKNKLQVITGLEPA
jgi:hypothetical protein